MRETSWQIILYANDNIKAIVTFRYGDSIFCVFLNTWGKILLRLPIFIAYISFSQVRCFRWLILKSSRYYLLYIVSWECDRSIKNVICNLVSQLHRWSHQIFSVTLELSSIHPPNIQMQYKWVVFISGGQNFIEFIEYTFSGRRLI